MASPLAFYSGACSTPEPKHNCLVVVFYPATPSPPPPYRPLCSLKKIVLSGRNDLLVARPANLLFPDVLFAAKEPDMERA